MFLYAEHRFIGPFSCLHTIQDSRPPFPKPYHDDEGILTTGGSGGRVIM